MSAVPGEGANVDPRLLALTHFEADVRSAGVTPVVEAILNEKMIGANGGFLLSGELVPNESAIVRTNALGPHAMTAEWAQWKALGKDLHAADVRLENPVYGSLMCVRATTRVDSVADDVIIPLVDGERKLVRSGVSLYDEAARTGLRSGQSDLGSGRMHFALFAESEAQVFAVALATARAIGLTGDDLTVYLAAMNGQMAEITRRFESIPPPRRYHGVASILGALGFHAENSDATRR